MNDPAAALDLPDLITAVELLRSIDAKLDLLLEQQQRRHATPPIDPTCHAMMVAATAGRAFSARELRQHADTVDAPLGVALDAAGLVDARRLGKWLKAIEGQTIGGVRLERLGVDNQGAVWIFRESTDSHSHSHVGRP